MPTQKPCFFLLNGEQVLIEPMDTDGTDRDRDRAGSLPCIGIDCGLSDKWRMPHCHEYHSNCEFCSCDGDGDDSDLLLSYMIALDRLELVPDLQREVAEGLICKECSSFVHGSDDIYNDIVVHNKMRKPCVYGRCIEVLEDWETPTWEEGEGVASLYSISWYCIAEGIDGIKNGLCLFDPLFIVCGDCYDVLHYAKRRSASGIDRNLDNVFLTKGHSRKEIVRNIRKMIPELRLKMEMNG